MRAHGAAFERRIRFHKSVLGIAENSLGTVPASQPMNLIVRRTNHAYFTTTMAASNSSDGTGWYAGNDGSGWPHGLLVSLPQLDEVQLMGA